MTSTRSALKESLHVDRLGYELEFRSKKQENCLKD